MLAMRRILVPILLAALLTTAVGSYVQARRSDASADPGWIEDAGPPQTIVGTPMLSVRRTPSWLSAPVTEARLLKRLSGVVALPSAPPQTCLAVYRGLRAGRARAGRHAAGSVVSDENRNRGRDP